MKHFIILAGGEGKRALGRKNKLPKQFYNYANISPLEYLLSSINKHHLIDSITIVVNKNYRKLVNDLPKKYKKIENIVNGGLSRHESSFKGLNSLFKKYNVTKNDIVLIHDAARPFVSKKLITNCLNKLESYDGVFPSLDIDDTLRKKTSLDIVNRNSLITSQTPQAFNLSKIFKAYTNTKDQFTDDVSVAHEQGLKIKKIKGDRLNFKITTYSDIKIYKDTINRNSINKVGIGYDFHKFKKGNFIKLGGIKLKSRYSLEANSDGDPVLHSVTDAILGALGKDDIGKHFRPSDKKYKGANSKIFVKKAVDLLNESNGRISNLDINIICDYPKITPLRNKILESISKMLEVKKSKINLKSTSTEKEGFVNTKYGIAAQSIISIEVPNE